MIRCLSAVFYLAKPLMGTSGSLTNSLGKKLIIHKMGAGTGSKETTVFYQFQATKVDLPVSLYCILNRTSGLGKCRRIQNHHIELLFSFFQFRKKFEYILTEELHCSIQSIQLCVGFCLMDCKLRSIHAKDFSGSCESGIQCKRSCMGKAVQDSGSFT